MAAPQAATPAEPAAAAAAAAPSSTPVIPQDPNNMELTEVLKLVGEQHEKNRHSQEKCRRIREQVDHMRTYLKRKRPEITYWDDCTIRFVRQDVPNLFPEPPAVTGEPPKKKTKMEFDNMKKDAGSLLNLHCQLAKCENPKIEYKPAQTGGTVCHMTLLQPSEGGQTQPYEVKGVTGQHMKKDARHDCAKALLLALYPGTTDLDGVAQKLFERRKEHEIEMAIKRGPGRGRGRGRWGRGRGVPMAAAEAAPAAE